LTCDFRNRAGEMVHKDRPYLQATVEVAGKVTQVKPELPPTPHAWTDFSYPEGAPVYHGPAFRGVTATAFDQQGGWGRIASLRLEDLVGPARAAGWMIPSAVLDAALYACGVHLYAHGEGAISLPKAIDQLRLGRKPRTGETCLVWFVCQEITRDSACYDFTVVGQDGSLIVAAEGYRKVILGREVRETTGATA
jgi:hypothetical protein